MAATIDGTTGLTAPSGAIFNGIASGTAVVTTSGTSIDFTSIPAWVKRITVMFNGVSTNGTSNLQVQIGSSSVTTSGYACMYGNGGSATVATSGFLATASNAASALRSGQMVLTLLSSNAWVESSIVGDTSNGIVTSFSSGNSPALGGALDRVRLTTVNGTDTFDAGSINILYE